MRNELPRYGDEIAQAKLKPGLYLGLFHGRKAVDEDLDDWGFDGPMIGPVKYVQTTYAAEVKIEFENREDMRKYFPAVIEDWEKHGYANSPEWQLPIQEDLLVYEGEFFGDWMVFVVGNVLPTAAMIAAGLKAA